MIVGIDVDGVLANFCHAYRNLTINVTGKNLFPAESANPLWLPPAWYWDTYYGYTDQEAAAVWGAIRSSVDFWSALKVFPDVEDILYSLDNSTNEVYFVTDRSGQAPQLQTQVWLETHDFSIPSVIISRKGKGLVANALSLDFYVDDKGENIVDVEAKSPTTNAFLIDTPYNQHVTVKHRVKNLSEAIKLGGVL